MARRRLTVKRIDPWSVLKFGFVANLVLLVIFMMLMGVVWFIIDRLQIVDQVCGIATDIGFTQCGINAPNLFQSLLLLGLLWVVIQSAVYVFLAFLYNLIADLVGGLGMTIIDDTVPSTVVDAPENSYQVSPSNTHGPQTDPTTPRSRGQRVTQPHDGRGGDELFGER